jgi:hypothetical protein
MAQQEDLEAREVLLLAGGFALLVFGAGLIMAHPAIRRSVKVGLGTLMPSLQEPLRTSVGGVMPDVERYLKIRAM